MWFGILTPGAHPSRPAPLVEATVFGWSARDRRRFDGPLGAVHGGLRVLRRQFHASGLPPAPPRCFVCRRPCPLPDPELVRRKTRVPGLHGLAESFPPSPAASTFALVHLGEERGGADPPLDETALLVVPGAPFALPFPLEGLPHALRVLEQVMLDRPVPECAGCGVVLPGSAEQRDAMEPVGVRRGPSRRERRSHGRRAA